MQVSSTTSTYASTDSTSSTTSTRTPKQTLGQEDFLKLITVQLANQDPMKPMEDTQFIAQMAQFTSLEQTNQLNREFAKLRASTDLSSASGLIGRQVTVEKDDGSTVLGNVEAVDNTTDTPRLLINGELYPYSSVTKVEAASTQTTQPAA